MQRRAAFRVYRRFLSRDAVAVLILGDTGQIVLVKKLLDGIFELLDCGRGFGFPSRQECKMVGSLTAIANLQCIIVYELLGEVVGLAGYTTLQTFAAVYLAGLHVTFDLVPLTFCTCPRIDNLSVPLQGHNLYGTGFTHRPVSIAV